MSSLLKFYDELTAQLRQAGEYLPLFFLRVILFIEFWEAGITKLRGENWFGDIPWADWQVGFPFPFDLFSVDFNWFAATWGELIFSVMLLLGIFTRFAAFSILVITVVATVAVHWPAEWNSIEELWKGYVITSKGYGNFKLPLLFAVMLLPLIFYGGGRLSLDQLLLKYFPRSGVVGQSASWVEITGLSALVIGIPALLILPVLGVVLTLAGVFCVVLHIKNR